MAAARSAWTSQAAFVRRFAMSGGLLATGTGFEWKGYPVPGAGIHRELSALVRAGLTPAEAIRAATLGGADVIGAVAGPGVGRIATGADASFLLVTGDPLVRIEDLEHLSAVIRGGEVLEPATLVSRIRRGTSGAVPK